MKKTLTLFALLVICFAANAQKVTSKDLQGTWKLLTYSDDEVDINAEKGTFKLKEEYKKGLSKNELDEDLFFYENEMANYQTIKVVFKGDEITLGTEAQSQTAKYSLSANSEMTIVTDGGDEQKATISVKGKILTIEEPGEFGSKMVFKKA